MKLSHSHCLVALTATLLPWQPASGQFREPDLQGPFRARVVRVFEGDNFELRFRDGPGGVRRFRLVNANTPSPFSDKACEQELGIEVRDYVRELIQVGQIRVWDLRSRGRNRWEMVGRIEFDTRGPDGRERLDLGTHLIARGFAVPYDDSRRNPERRTWPCDDPAESFEAVIEEEVIDGS